MTALAATALRVGPRAIGAAALACVAVGIAVAIPQTSSKSLLFMLVGLAGAVAVVLSGRAQELLLAGYIIALTYNRQYFSFDSILGNNGSEGLYWIPADALLALLLGVSLFQQATGARRPATNAAPAAAIALPAIAFLLPCVVSSLYADRPDLSFNELARVLRFIFVLVWLQRNMTLSMWWAAIIGFAVAIVAQAALGTAQVVLHADRNLLSVFGVGGQQIFTNDGELDVLDNRARGTMGHPNYLAPWLLVLLPAGLGLFLWSRVRQTRLIALGVLLVGTAGMIATKSRAPIALLAFASLIVTALAVRERRLSLAAACSALVLIVTLLAGIGTYYADAIAQRIWGDFSASVTFRTEYNQAALEIWDELPLFGIGLNNATLALGRHSPLFHWLTVQLEQYRGGASVRAVAPVHNVYLLILAETGIVGLIGFLILLGSAFRRAVRGYIVSEDGTRGLCLGLSAGLGVQFAQQTLDFSQWFDPSWYTLAVLMAVIGSIPALRPTIR